jgi:ATP-dependent DNA helicase RecG
MSLNRVKRLLQEKENIRLEFKKATSALPVNLFETICAMLNREGGDVLLGVADDGTIKGVEKEKVKDIVNNIVNLSNNFEKLDPPFILFPQTYEIEGCFIIHIQVPASSQVHKTAQTVYDRSNDGDFKVVQPHRIAEISNRKRNHYTEGIIYPALRFEDFNQDLFPKIKNLIRSYNVQHPWLALDNKQMLEIAGLWKRDFQSGQEGYTLAAALLLGKDEVIRQIVPHYKIDALVRIKNTLRYDDREYIQTNLIEAYEQLMAFTAKHLPDKFYMEGDQRVSLRNKIFREVAANLIVHREYLSAASCTFIIYADRVETENANNPHGEGPIDPFNFSPFPKNPLIAKFFIQLGWVEELGSGVLNTSRLVKEYTGNEGTLFIEGSIFKTIIPIPSGLTSDINDTVNTVSDTVNTVGDTVNDTVKVINDTVNTVGDTVNDTVKKRMVDIIHLLQEKPGLKSKELGEMVGISEVSIRRDMQKLSKLVEFKGTPRTGGYYLTDYMLSKLNNK